MNQYWLSSSAYAARGNRPDARSVTNGLCGDPALSSRLISRSRSESSVGAEKSARKDIVAGTSFSTTPTNLTAQVRVT
jgi:hypothetical protein